MTRKARKALKSIPKDYSKGIILFQKNIIIPKNIIITKNVIIPKNIIFTKA